MATQSYELAAPARCCARTGRELKPGEPFFSVLFDRAGRWVREEIAAEAWPGPPAEAFSFWRTHVPTEKKKGPPKLNEELLWECFLRTQGQTEPQQLRFRFVLALLLMRKKRLKLEETKRDAAGEWLLLKEAKRKASHAVFDPKLKEDELAAAEKEIEQLAEL